MSHQPQRKEKDCLNCGTIVHGTFCHICGQENIVTKQNFISLVKHFIYDVFHFDGKFFDTLKYLITRPGYIPKKYIEGKRQSYLDPIRMYLFTSALFFLVFFAIGDSNELFKTDEPGISLSRNDRLVLASQLLEKKDSAKLEKVLDTAFRIHLDPVGERIVTDSTSLIQWKGNWYVMKDTLFRNILSTTDSNDWFSKRLDKKWQEYRVKYGDDTTAMLGGLSSAFLHKLPYILFVSIPFFALILKLLYIRRKNRLFSEHSIFTLYHYIFSFILLLFLILLEALEKWTGWSLFNLINILVFLSGGVYLFIAMKRFYMQSGGKTLLKFILLNILAFTVLMFILIFFLIFSIIQL